MLINSNNIRRSHFSDFEIIEIENSGHWVHAEKPKEFFEVVSRYLIYYCLNQE